MNFDAKTRAWLMLICQVVGTGGGITITTYEGGCKLWVAVLAGLAAGATNVYHSLAASPQDKSGS